MLNKSELLSLVVVRPALYLGSAHAGSGYLKDSAADIVRNGYGECWHTGFWQPEDAVVGCDGMKMREPEKKMTKTQRLDRIVLDAET